MAPGRARRALAPAQVADDEAVASIVALAVLCSAVAYLLDYRLMTDVGPTRALTVTFLMPVFGMVWGVVFLGEVVTTSMLAGCALVIAGTFVVLRAPAAAVRKAPAATTPSHGSTGP